MNKLNILVVEDTEEHAELIIRVLKRGLDCEIEAVRTGEDALLSMEKTPFDCAIIDYCLPGMGGLEILHSAQKLDHRPPILMLTNQGNEQVASTAIAKGAAGYYQKKDILNAEAFCRVVQSAIRRAAGGNVDIHNEHRFLSIMRLSFDLICRVHADGSFYLFGEQVYRLLGYTALELEGRKFLDYVHPDDRDRTNLMFQRAIDTQQLISGFEDRLIGKTGRIVPLIWNCEPESNVPALMCVAHAKPGDDQLQHELALTNDLLIIFNGLVGSVLAGAVDWMNIGNALTLFNRAAGTDSAMIHLLDGQGGYTLKMFRGRRKRLQDVQMVVPGEGILGRLCQEPRPKAMIFNQTEIPHAPPGQDGLFLLFAPTGVRPPAPGLVTFAGPASAAGAFRLGLPMTEQLARIIDLALSTGTLPLNGAV